MTLDEAIRIQTILQGAPVLKEDPRVVEALKLGIEAMKRCKRYKDFHIGLHYEPLPGETKG